MAVSSSYWWFSAVCLFSFLGLMTSIYIMGDTIVLLSNRSRLDVTEKHIHAIPVRIIEHVHVPLSNWSGLNVTEKYVYAIPVRNTTSQLDVSTTTSQTSLVTLHCKAVCSKSAGDTCVPMDLAIFVYKNDTPTENMNFIQNYNPVVRRARQSNTSSVSSVLDIERCNLEEHFPGVELIPRQTNCAVVGNSGILNNSSCRDFIDSHDFVIRANMGLIKGYEVDVGQKANLIVFDQGLMTSYGRAFERTKQSQKGSLSQPQKLNIQAKLFDHIKTLNKSILWYPKRMYHSEYRSMVNAIRKRGFSGIQFAYSWKSIRVEKIWGIRGYATLGLNMYTVARTFSSNITLFGFYPFYQDLEGRPVRYHYFEDVKYDYSHKKVHDFDFEYRKLKELESQGNLTLVVRDCKPRKQP